MKKLICDLCGIREAVESFKVKQRRMCCSQDEFGNNRTIERWNRVDICNQCFCSLIDAMRKERNDD